MEVISLLHKFLKLFRLSINFDQLCRNQFLVKDSIITKSQPVVLSYIYSVQLLVNQGRVYNKFCISQSSFTLHEKLCSGFIAMMWILWKLVDTLIYHVVFLTIDIIYNYVRIVVTLMDWKRLNSEFCFPGLYPKSQGFLFLMAVSKTKFKT